MKKDQEEITAIIEGRASILAGILSEINIWDMKEVQKIISIHMKDTVSESLKPGKENIRGEIENGKEDPERKTLKEKLEERQMEIYKKLEELHTIIHSTGTKRQQKKDAAKEIFLLKPELKRINVSLNSLQSEEEYLQLKRFILKNYGEFILRQFYKTIPPKKKSKPKSN